MEMLECFYQLSLKVPGGLIANNKIEKRQIVWSLVEAQAADINRSSEFLRVKFRNFMLAKHEYLKARRMILANGREANIIGETSFFDHFNEYARINPEQGNIDTVE